MRTLARWTWFTLSISAIGLGGLFLLHYLARHYAGLQSPAVLLTALTVFCAASALASISFASKMDEEAERLAPRSGDGLDAGSDPRTLVRIDPTLDP
jgi:hypothetical protein